MCILCLFEREKSSRSFKETHITQRAIELERYLRCAADAFNARVRQAVASFGGNEKFPATRWQELTDECRARGSLLRLVKLSFEVESWMQLGFVFDFLSVLGWNLTSHFDV